MKMHFLLQAAILKKLTKWTATEEALTPPKPDSDDEDAAKDKVTFITWVVVGISGTPRLLESLVDHAHPAPDSGNVNASPDDCNHNFCAKHCSHRQP